MASIDFTAPATGAYAVQAVALIVIGAWIAGANLLAGPWLTSLRWFGVLTGVVVVLYGIGRIVSGNERTLVYIAGVAYLALLPIWGLLMGSFLGRLARSGDDQASVRARATASAADIDFPADRTRSNSAEPMASGRSASIRS